MPEPERRTPIPLGQVEVVSPPGVLEVLPGYQGPRTVTELGHELPPQYGLQSDVMADLR